MNARHPIHSNFPFKMWYLTAAVFVVTVVSGFAVPLNEIESKDRVRDLLDAANTYYHNQVKVDPLPIRGFSNVVLYDGVLLNTTDTKLFGLSQAVVSNVTTDPNEVIARFRFTLPQIVLETQYALVGKIDEHYVEGHGSFKFTGTNFSFFVDDLEFSETYGLKIKQLHGEFSLENLSLDCDNIKLDGKVVPHACQAIGTWMKMLYYRSVEQISSWITQKLRSSLDYMLIRRRTMEEVTEWLHEHAHDNIDLDVTRFSEIAL